MPRTKAPRFQIETLAVSFLKISLAMLDKRAFSMWGSCHSKPMLACKRLREHLKCFNVLLSLTCHRRYIVWSHGHTRCQTIACPTHPNHFRVRPAKKKCVQRSQATGNGKCSLARNPIRGSSQEQPQTQPEQTNVDHSVLRGKNRKKRRTQDPNALRLRRNVNESCRRILGFG